MRLKEAARWNQTEGDWCRLLQTEPRGCFCAVIDCRVVGTITTTTYGSELAWVGMVLVDPAYRRRGIATGLLNAALEYLSAAQVATVKLDATPDGQKVYEQLGFKVESLIERRAGVAGETTASGCATLDASSGDEVFALDRRAFGADRAKLIERLITDACVAPQIVAAPDGQVRGYALARRGSNAAYLGPLVATDLGTATTLLDAALTQLSGQQVYVDVNTNFAQGTEVLAARGFIRQRDLIRMSYGAESSPTSASVFAIAGPEVG
ncbi:MAG: GNAT family N-acetyltransferase [Pyrinomonadaceae bacterium]